MFSEKTYLLSALMLSLLRCQEEEGRKKGGGGGKGQLRSSRLNKPASKVNGPHMAISRNWFLNVFFKVRYHTKVS